MKSNPKVKKALLQKNVDCKLICNTCEKHCRMGGGEVGFCKTRKNINGKIYTLIYADVSSLSINPIEKKPLFHFHPGSSALTVGSWSCNFTCPWCQNNDISKQPEKVGDGGFIPPKEFIRLMKEYDCQGTSISFNEPILSLEYAVDVLKLAQKEGYYNTFITNGYMTIEALDLLMESGLDAMNIDIKGNKESVLNYCQANIDKIWRNAKIAKEKGIWVEITTLIIPGVNDDRNTLGNIAKRIKNELGENTPWHVTRYFPCYKFTSSSTPLNTINEAINIGQEGNLKYVYSGNISNDSHKNTYCPNCDSLLVKREDYTVSQINLTSDSNCSQCGEKIPIITEIDGSRGKKE